MRGVAAPRQVAVRRSPRPDGGEAPRRGRCLARRRSPARMDLPVDISADFHPVLLRLEATGEATRLVQSLPPDAPEFDSIVHRAPPMKEAVALARQVAPARSRPVLVLGESGTGRICSRGRSTRPAIGAGPSSRSTAARSPRDWPNPGLRAREGGLHGRRGGPGRALPGGRRGNAVPRRGGGLPSRSRSSSCGSCSPAKATPVGGSKTHQVNVRVSRPPTATSPP